MRWHCTLVTFCVLLSTGAVCRAQTRTETIRGRVLTDSAAPVRDAEIHVTMAPDRTSFQTTSDSAGYYQLRIANGSGDYLVHIAALGRTAVRRRITRTGTDSIFVFDVRLPALVQQLAAVRVQTSRPRPTRGADFATGVGANEQIVDALTGETPPDVAGDFSAAALTVPGFLASASGFTALGLPANQNSVTLGGLAFPSADLPRDARTTTRVSTSSYDPSRGWFGGATVSTELISGSLFRSARGHITADAPPLQADLPVARALGRRFTRVQASYGADGPLTYRDRDFFNLSVQASRQVSTVQSVGDADGATLEQLGLARDSTQLALALLRSTGVPTGGFAGTTRITDAASFVGRFDHAPVDLKAFVPPRTTYGITIFSKLVRTDAVGVVPTATAGHGGTTSLAVGSVQGAVSTFLLTDYLNETRSAISLSDSRSTPYLDVPDGRVLLSSPASSASSGTALAGDLAFGGNAALAAHSRTLTWETINETKFYVPGRAGHRVKLALDARFDRADEAAAPNRSGTFSYASLAALAANAPASFTRTLTPADAAGGEWNAFAALGDLWRVSPALQITYGARLEGNRFTDAPPRNDALERALNVADDGAPNSLHVSPRLGFTWYFRPPTSSSRTNSLGTFTIGPRAFLRGGVGEFRSMLAPSLLAPASVYTGLAGGVRQLACVGSAVPAPDWNSYVASAAAIPSACVGAASVFADSAPRVQLVSAAYRPARSWRGNLGYGSTYKRVTYAIDGVYSINLDQPSVADLNFSDRATFTTATEGRPVFVPVSSIVPGSGLAAPAAGRRSSQFGQMLESRSDLRSASRQAAITVTPALSASWYLSSAYTLASVRVRQRGFDGTTFDTPAAVSTGRGDLDARHQVLISLGYTAHGLSIGGQAHVVSGLPFTPLVASDVNGDGFVNDRAFVFDPTRATDLSLAHGIQTLLDAAPTAVRDCLRAQLGRAAGLNSCEGPWTATMNAQLSFAAAALQAHRVSSIALSINNALGGLDQALHGTSGLRGWGAPAFPDRTLYRVEGFDPARLAYRYVVNPGFGGTTTSRANTLSPFRLTLDVTMNLGRPLGEQQLDQWLKPGRSHNPGPRLSADDLRKRYERNVPDPYALVLQEADSLLLSREQVDRLTAARASYRVRMDSLWAVVSTRMAALGDDYDGAEMLKYQEAMVDAGWELTRAEVQGRMRELLSPVQRRLLPGWAGTYDRAAAPMAGYRYFSFGTPP